MRRLTFAVVGCAVALSACDDPDRLTAQLPTAEDFYTVFALSGTPAAYPSGINTYFRAAVRVDGNGNFDVAFDLDEEGRVLVHPVQKVVTSLSTGRRVGLRRVDGSFDLVTIAPPGTYADSSLAVSPGEVFVVQAVRNAPGDACQFDFSPYIYTKMAVDSVTSATRGIFVRTVLDPNCGFRSFESGIPTR